MTVAAVAAVAVGARAQVIQAPAGQAYTIANNVSASAVTEVTYQWYRDNSPIPNATKESYTVPAAAAYGDNVAFYRMATAQECAGVAEKKSNIITITFTGYTMPAGCNLVVSGVCWADAHIDNPQTFAAQADMYTKLYQWNRLTAFSALEPLTPAWNSTIDSSATLMVNLCPPSWRQPTQDELVQLSNAGSIWAEANTRGNTLNGRFFGYNHATCRLPSNMSGCVFFPAGGYRPNPAGDLTNKDLRGYVSGSTQNTVISARHCMSFGDSDINPLNICNRSSALPIRCVK